MLNSPRIADTSTADTEAPTAPTETNAVERATMLCDLGRFGDAVPAVGLAIAQDPRNPGAWCLMARAQLGNDRASAALKAAQAAGSLAPDHEWPHRLASSALSQLGRDAGVTDLMALHRLKIG